MAQLLIHQRGKYARNEADKKLRYFLKADDVKASSLWLNIGSAIEELEKISSSSFMH